MEFKNSDLVDPTTYRTEGLCHGISLRISKDATGEIRGAIRCQRDWSKLVGPLEHYKGTLGNPFSFVRVTVPETLPGRLEIISYANEFAFLYDGKSALSPPDCLVIPIDLSLKDSVTEDLENNLVSLGLTLIETIRKLITHIGI